MFIRLIPTILLFLSIACYTRMAHLGGQSRFSETIRSKTRESVSASVKWHEEGISSESVMESAALVATLGELLADTASVPKASARYMYVGTITFHNGTNAPFRIDCFNHNTIRMDGRYYKVSRDFFAMVRNACETARNTEDRE